MPDLKVRALLGRRALDNAINMLAQGVIISNPDGKIISVNRAFSALTGYVLNDFESKSYGQLLNGPLTDKNTIAQIDTAHADLAKYFGEILHYRKGGTSFWSEITISPIFDNKGRISNFITTTCDISERVDLYEKTKELAFFDQLTSLPNRNLLLDRLNQALINSQRSAYYGALLFIDVDNLKLLNDQYGHEVGDLLLIEVAKRIQSSIRANDTSSRFGGDEFVVILSEFTANLSDSMAQVKKIVEKIVSNLAGLYLFTIKSDIKSDLLIEFRCSASIGVSLFLGNRKKPSNIIKQADMAMYEAKKIGGNQVQFYADCK